MSMHHDHNSMVGRNFMKKIGFLDSAQRKQDLSPEEILSIIPCKRFGNILDVGAGSGYLTLPAAKLADGSVHALDTDARMLDVIHAKAKTECISNINLIHGSVDSIPLPDSAVDLALVSLILHEVRPLDKVLKEISRVLKPNGYFLCLEYERKDTAEGPPMNIRISSCDMEQALISAGFHIVQQLTPIKSIYIIVAQRCTVQ